MKTKLRFKIIAALICLSLAALLFSQGYWLKGLYDSTWEQVNGNIQDAMRMADYKELFIRMDSLSENKGSGTITSEIKLSKDSTEEISRNGLMDTFSIKADKNSFKYNEAAESLNEYLDLLTSLEGQIQEALHVKLDSLIPNLSTISCTILYSSWNSNSTIFPSPINWK